jgi:nucleoside-diphosphate-sugar epimerase
MLFFSCVLNLKLNPQLLLAGMQGCDTVVHAAAKIDDWGEYSEFQKATVDGTRNVVEAAKAAGVSKFVHVSTEAVLVKVLCFSFPCFIFFF